MPRYLSLALLCLWACQPANRLTESALPVADPDNGAISLPAGFGAVVVADTLGRALRHLTVHANGDIYVKLDRLRDGKGILGLRDTSGDGRADVMTAFGTYTGTGIRIHEGYLYASSDSAVYRYALTGEDLLRDPAEEVVIRDFPGQRSHAAKSMTFDGAGHLYVNVGGPANACQQERRTPGSPGEDPCPLLERHAGIWRFDLGRLDQTQLDDGYRYATGIRHAVALAWNPAASQLYALQHGRDQLSGLWPELFTDAQNAELPAEEFIQIEDGDDFGWPYCYYDPARSQKVLSPEYGGDGEMVGRCASKKDPMLAFPAHLAPNDLLFYTGDQFPARYRNGAFIAFHGSWNRAPLPQEGFYVVFVPLENGQPSGDWEVFADGFGGAERLDSPGDAVYRPCGLAQGPDGALYVTDSRQGRIWRILYYGTSS